jgi:hypothetical protein
MTVLLLLDFSKAFDSVITTLYSRSPQKSYSSDRHQCVCVGDEISSMAQSGKVLFKVRFWDPCEVEVIMFSQAHLYANDVQIYISGV